MARLRLHSAWLAVGALAILGAWLYFDLKQPVREPGENPTIAELLGIKAREVTGIEVVRGKERLILRRSGAAWRITAPTELRADAETVRTALTGLLDPTTDYILEHPDRDRKQYGLASPSRSIKLITQSRSVVLYLGSADPSKASVYARTDAGTSIFLIGASAVNGLAEKSADDLRDRTILALTAADIEEIRLVRGSGALTLQRKRSGWRLTEPVAATADEFTAGDLCSALATLKAERFVAPDSPRAGLGLDRPLVSVELRAKGGASYGLRIGRAAPGGASYYAVRADNSDVVEIPRTIVDDLTRPIGDFRSKRLIDASTDAVTEIAARTSEAQWAVRKAGEDWEFRLPDRKARADSLAVDNLLMDITSPADRWLADHPSDAELRRYGLKPPTATILLTLKSGAVERLEIGSKTPDGSRYVRGSDNNDAVYAISSATADRMLKAPDKAR